MLSPNLRRPARPLALATLAAAVAIAPGCGPLGSSAPATEIDVGPETLAFRGTSTATIDIIANGSWVAEAQQSWLKVENTGGSGGSEELTVTVDRSELDVGSYQGEIVVRGDEDTSVTVPVTMRFPELSGNVQSSDGHLASIRATPAAALVPGKDYAPGEILVGLDRPMVALSVHGSIGAEISAASLQAASESLAASVGATSAELRSSDLGLAKLTIDSDDVSAAIAAIERDGRARYAQPNYYYYPTATANDEHYELQWHYERIRLEEAWDVTTGYEEVVVAVIDGDFHPDHPDLADNLLPGWNFVYDSSEVAVFNSGCSSHASHVSGTIGAVTDNDEGVAGIAPNIRILPLNVALRPEDEPDPSRPQCQLSGQAIVDAIAYAGGADVGGAAPRLDRRVDVINMSLGGGGDPAMEEAVEFAHGRGVTVVAAAGNDSRGPVSFPAAYPEAIAVSATGLSDQLTSYSNIGSEVWVAAPGGDGVGTDGVISTAWNYQDDVPGYSGISGTSMASPHVAGVAALILSANPGLSPDEVANVLADTAVDLGSSGRDDEYGHGLIDAAAAVAAARDNLRVSTNDVVVRLYRGNRLVEEVSAGAGGAFEFGELEAGEYRLVAGNARNGELGVPGTVYGEIDFEISYDGDPEIEVSVSAR